mmetsp:Transcript_40678/g.127261  ORF Transcript_40678/g.127261 Transcript_40678/m.127261 type:complete len:226 (+) Transcript_40678:657-1334(+)
MPVRGRSRVYHSGGRCVTTSSSTSSSSASPATPSPRAPDVTWLGALSVLLVPSSPMTSRAVCPKNGGLSSTSSEPESPSLRGFSSPCHFFEHSDEPLRLLLCSRTRPGLGETLWPFLVVDFCLKRGARWWLEARRCVAAGALGVMVARLMDAFLFVRHFLELFRLTRDGFFWEPPAVFAAPSAVAASGPPAVFAAPSAVAASVFPSWATGLPAPKCSRTEGSCTE